MTTTAPTWLTLVLDAPRASQQPGSEFWRRATGYETSTLGGDGAEFATLNPPTGDTYLRIQSTEDGAFGVHMDLHIGDLNAAVERAVAVGAEVLARPGHAIMQSPAGFVFCFALSHDETTRATPRDWGNSRSIADQLTIDIAPDAWDREKTFWSDLTGWSVTQSGRPEFARLRTPPLMPVRVLLQRRDTGGTSGHLDIATDNRPAEVERLSGLGATAVRNGPVWTVMAGPDGSVFCVTDRDPQTGLLP